MWISIILLKGIYTQQSNAAQNEQAHRNTHFYPNEEEKKERTKLSLSMRHTLLLLFC